MIYFLAFLLCIFLVISIGCKLLPYKQIINTWYCVHKRGSRDSIDTTVKSLDDTKTVWAFNNASEDEVRHIFDIFMWNLYAKNLPKVVASKQIPLTGVVGFTYYVHDQIMYIEAITWVDKSKTHSVNYIDIQALSAKMN